MVHFAKSEGPQRGLLVQKQVYQVPIVCPRPNCTGHGLQHYTQVFDLSEKDPVWIH